MKLPRLPRWSMDAHLSLSIGPEPEPERGDDDVPVPPTGATAQVERAEQFDHDTRAPVGFAPPPPGVFKRPPRGEEQEASS